MYRTVIEAEPLVKVAQEVEDVFPVNFRAGVESRLTITPQELLSYGLLAMDEQGTEGLSKLYRAIFDALPLSRRYTITATATNQTTSGDELLYVGISSDALTNELGAVAERLEELTGHSEINIPRLAIGEILEFPDEIKVITDETSRICDNYELGSLSLVLSGVNTQPL